jgi:putative DNA primase/helicase
MWLNSREQATEWIAYANGAVNVLSGEVRARSPDLWVHSALGFDWNPSAACPVWEWFLQDIFPDDDESKQFIEEWMGYCMTDDVRLHKGAMLIGKGRNGKGTIAHVIRRLVGDASFVSLNFDTWVKTENSTAPIIGRKVGCFGDVRLKRGKEYGAQFYDPGGLNQAPSQRNCSKNTPIPNSACGI